MTLPASHRHSKPFAPSMLRSALFMGGSYALGTFNDNFFKQACLLLAVAAEMTAVQADATVLFALPFILFSVWSGWFADHFPKQRIILTAKVLELLAMLVGAWGLLTLNWTGMLAMVFCMGLSSTLFSPALNGSIPELFPSDRVPAVNGIFKLTTTITILMGIALAGVALDIAPPLGLVPELPDWLLSFGLFIVASGAIAVAIIGVLCALFIPRRAAADHRHPFPWAGPLAFFPHIRTIYRRDPSLFVVLFAESFFYFLATLLLLVINNFGLRELGLSNSATGTLAVALMIGIGLGSLLAARGTPDSWRSLMVPSLLGLALLLCLLPLCLLAPSSWQVPLIAALYLLIGSSGGLYLIPLTSAIQVRPPASAKGRTLGLSNTLSFTGILLAGQVFRPLDMLPPSTAHLVLGVGTVLIAMVFAVIMIRLHPGPSLGQRALAGLVRALIRLRYRVTVQGVECLRSDGRPMLILPNHPALIDPAIVYTRLAPHVWPRPVADSTQINLPLIRTLAKAANAVVIPDIRRQGVTVRTAVTKAMEQVIAVLKQGESVLLYPAGHLTRNGLEEIGGNAGLHQIITAVPEVRLILVRTRGLWGSRLSWGWGRAPSLSRICRPTLLALATSLLFFLPRRAVVVEFHEPDLPRDAGRIPLNRALEAFYNADPEQPTATAWHCWLSVPPLPTLSPQTVITQDDPAGVDPDIRQQVYAYLHQQTDVRDITDRSRLSADLGIDSLALTTVSLWLEETFHQHIDRLDVLNTVGDCVLAAAGRLRWYEPPIAVPKDWFASGPVARLDLPDGETLPALIVAQARRHPRQGIIADRSVTLRSRDFLTKAWALSGFIRRLPPGNGTIGIMLPASPAAAVVWLAALLAERTPVLCNWTTGIPTLNHCLELTGTTHILTAQQLLDRLAQQGFAAETVKAEWVALETVAPQLTLADKVRAAACARWGRVATLDPDSPAAILFTSGSETLPKAVPLTHRNILSNCRDLAQTVAITNHDRILGMLPPFHSLGLTGTLVLPLVVGMPVVYHPNPTEAVRLITLIRAYKTTALIAPPTFLAAILQHARSGDLTSLRIGVVGAEKCSDAVYAAFAAACPSGVLCEGYGITETAPVISLNPLDAPRPGTIGLPLPSVITAIVNEDADPPCRAAPDEPGMLLVRGPNVFGGYLGAVASPFVSFDGSLWYRTGDRVSQSADGYLTFHGRLKRFVKIGGEMISLPRIEAVLLDAFADRTPPDQDGPLLAVDSPPDSDGKPEIILFSTIPLHREEANATLRAAGLSGLFNITRVQCVDTIPVLGSGKTNYRQLQENMKIP